MKDQKKTPFNPNFSLGLNLAIGMLFCTVVGYLIDEKNGEGHVGLIGGVVVGVIFVLYEIWKSIRSL